MLVRQWHKEHLRPMLDECRKRLLLAETLPKEVSEGYLRQQLNLVEVKLRFTQRKR